MAVENMFGKLSFLKRASRSLAETGSYVRGVDSITLWLHLASPIFLLKAPMIGHVRTRVANRFQQGAKIMAALKGG